MHSTLHMSCRAGAPAYQIHSHEEGSSGTSQSVRTILIRVISHGPALHLPQTGELEQPIGARGRILDALLDLNALVGSDGEAEDATVARGGQEGLVTSAVFVVDVLADDAPVGDVEDLLSVEDVGVCEAVEDESEEVSVFMW